MRIRFVLVLSVGLLALAATAQERQAPVDYTFQHGFLEQDQIVDLKELRGRPVYVEWWGANWPASVQGTVPYAVKLAGKNHGDLTVLMISVSGDKQQVERLALQQKWFGKGVLWAGETPVQPPAKDAPCCMLLDAKGRPVLTGNPIQDQIKFKGAIEAEIKLAKKGFPETPKDLRTPCKDASKGKWSVAITAAEELAAKQAGKDDALAEAATAAATAWREFAALTVARVGRLIEIGEYSRAGELLKQLDGNLAGIDDLAAQAVAFQEQLDSPDLEQELKAERALRKAEAKLFKDGSAKFKPAALEKMAEKYAGTKASVRAYYWLPLISS